MSRRIPMPSTMALTVFVNVAEQLSMTAAADVVGLSQSAVSQHIRALELLLQVNLFRRVGRGIELTPAGQLYYEKCRKILGDLKDATQQVLPAEVDRSTVSVSVSLSLGVRWLIPSLSAFHQLHPGVLVRVETLSGSESYPSQAADLSIVYRRAGDESEGDDILFHDTVLPIFAPGQTKLPVGWPQESPGDLAVLSSVPENWDWKAWATGNRLDVAKLCFADSFDTDDSALRAVSAGLGVALSSPAMIEFDRRSGILDVVPGTHPVRVGSYVLISGERNSACVTSFKTWLRSIAARTDQVSC